MSTLELRRLLPGPATEVAAAEAYAYPSAGRHVRVNMVSSIDGAATLGQRVGELTGPADQKLLWLLRALADVVVVGAGTLRAEGYGPLTVPDELRALREEREAGPAPRLVVPTSTLAVDLTSSAFTRADDPPLLVTTARAPEARRRRAEAVAEVVVLGEEAVDLPAMLTLLERRGASRILCEGGPALLAALFADDVVDELCLAVAPVVAAGPERRITAGAPLEPPRTLRLAQVAERDEFLFLRYLCERPSMRRRSR